MQPDDIGRLVTPSDPRVSPDGTLVAFTVTRVDAAANRYRSAVWLAATDGSHPPAPLTAGDEADAHPAWSPDGRMLALTSTDTDGRTRIRILPVTGPGEARTVAERDEAVDTLSWSPDGTRLAFASRERASRLREHDDDRARPPRRIDRLMPRLDGEGWIVDRPRAVFVVPADGTDVPHLVAAGRFDHAGPAWSPDGTTLAVTAVRDRPDADLEMIADLLLVDVDGAAGPRPLTDAGHAHAHPSFSPDGTRVAVLVEDAHVVPSHGKVAVVDVASGSEGVVSGALDRQCAPFVGARAPVWDGDDLLVAVEDHGDQHLYRVAADGSGTPEVVLGGRRVVTGYDLAGGVLAAVVSTPDRRPELVVVRDGQERRLTSLSAAFHAAVPVTEPEHLTVASPAGDGDLDAWLLAPTAPVDPDSVPLLVSIHGGPMTQYPSAWFDEFALWAGAGYAVLWCNPHGSSGGTEAFVRAIRPPEAEVAPGTGWGGIDADDVLAVLENALERDPSLDPDRVGILGGSYGGYLTSWLVAHTDRFAAACSERAANNLTSLEWGGSDLAGFFRFEFGVDHLASPEVYRRMSATTYAADITTPMLLLHAEDDLRCPPDQADQLYVALRLLGRDVEYWRFPAEGHELSRSGSPRHRIQRAEIILDFFGRHLGGRRPVIGWDHPSRADPATR